jgi:hypothetical protein
MPSLCEDLVGDDLERLLHRVGHQFFCHVRAELKTLGDPPWLPRVLGGDEVPAAVRKGRALRCLLG